jgi:site-specific recombinase XerD
LLRGYATKNPEVRGIPQGLKRTRLRQKAGLRKLRLHDLRHQYASFLVNSGRSLYEVQKILGHSSHSVTERYAHLNSKSLMDAANSASVIIEGAMPTAA